MNSKQGQKILVYFPLILGLVLFFNVLFLNYPSSVYADEVSTSVIVEVAPSPPPPSSGGGNYVTPPLPTKVILQGRAYPDSLVTVMKDGQIVETVEADSQARFKVEITDITPGIWSFTVWAEDSKGRKSIPFTFTTTVPKGMTTTISNIFLPPTIDLDKDKVIRGENLGIFGQTAPKSNVSIYVYSSGHPIIKETKADEIGVYFYNFNTAPLEEGIHNTKTKSSTDGGIVSDFSKTVAFVVSTAEEPEIPEESKKCILANLNCNFDKKGKDIINIVDFSILLYNWGAPKNLRADINKDGRVDIVDFSIMLYHWTW